MLAKCLQHLNNRLNDSISKSLLQSNFTDAQRLHRRNAQPFTATWNDPKHRCRKQIPLDLAWSITIHKSQGLTLDRAVIDIGKSENPLGGITFVAISRLRSLDGLYIQPMPWERLLQINKKVTIKQRIQEELRLFSL